MSDPSLNLQQFVDTLIENFVRSRFPASSTLEPELDAAIVANVALAQKALILYGAKALAKKVPAVGQILEQNGFRV